MQAFENTVTIQKPAGEVFRVPRGLRENPDVELRHRRDQQGFRWAGRGGDQVPPDPFGSAQERRELRGNRLRASQPAGHHGQIGPFQATISYVLEEGAGATTLVNSVELNPSPAMLKLLAPAATPRIKAAVAQNLGKLRLILENGRPA